MAGCMYGAYAERALSACVRFVSSDRGWDFGSPPIKYRYR